MRLAGFLLAIALFGLLVPTAAADNGRGNKHAAKGGDSQIASGYYTRLASGLALVGQNDPRVTVTPPDESNKPAVVCNERPSAWAQPIGESRWVSTQSNCTADFSVDRDFTYSVHFPLPANHGDVRLSGRVLSDNGVTVKLNDHQLLANGSYTAPSTFQSSSSDQFVDGDNVLTFVVRNGGGPTGLDFVANVGTGATVASDGGWRNHGQCVSAFAHEKGSDHGERVSEAARFTCRGDDDD